jgi:hypothetical protein
MKNKEVTAPKIFHNTPGIIYVPMKKFLFPVNILFSENYRIYLFKARFLKTILGQLVNSPTNAKIMWVM